MQVTSLQATTQIDIAISDRVALVEAPDGETTDVFLVLDGARARGLVVSGAFGEEQDGLRPMLRQLVDVESVRALLQLPRVA